MNSPELIERIRQGDGAALAEYIESRRAQLLAFIERRLGAMLQRKLEAEDILQEASSEAVRTLATAPIADRDPFSWICQVCERRIIDAHRYFAAQKRDAAKEASGGNASADESQRGGLVDLLAASMTSASKAFSRNVQQERLATALAQLSELQQEVLRLRYIDGLPSKEIADLTGKSDAAIRVMLTRTIKKLQEMLGDDPA